MSGESTPIVREILTQYGIKTDDTILEIGCGEGRDSLAVLDDGYDLLAVDISEEAIAYCNRIMPQYYGHFKVLDCLHDQLDQQFDFIYAIAVVHMLVNDEDRNGFYQFITDHLNKEGIALICTMGNGVMEMQTDVSQAFEIQEREHESGKMLVAATSCRMVSFETFEDELDRNGLSVILKGLTSAMPDFDSLMFAVVRRK